MIKQALSSLTVIYEVAFLDVGHWFRIRSKSGQDNAL